MRNEDFRGRTKVFALRIHQNVLQPAKVCASPECWGSRHFVPERAWLRTIAKHPAARSDAELVSKLGVVEQELDETLLWLELLVESGVVPETKMASLHTEGDELLRMTVAATKKAKARL